MPQSQACNGSQLVGMVFEASFGYTPSVMTPQVCLGTASYLGLESLGIKACDVSRVFGSGIAAYDLDGGAVVSATQDFGVKIHDNGIEFAGQLFGATYKGSFASHERDSKDLSGMRGLLV